MQKYLWRAIIIVLSSFLFLGCTSTIALNYTLAESGKSPSIGKGQAIRLSIIDNRPDPEIIGYGKSPAIPFNAFKEQTGLTDDSKIKTACVYLREKGFLTYQLHKHVGNSFVPFNYPEDGPKVIIGTITSEGAMYIEEHCLDKGRKMTIQELAM